MNSFWKNKPVAVTNKNQPFRMILDENKLVNQIQNDIDCSRISLDYSILDMTDDCCIESTLEFINANYIVQGSSITLKYSKDLYLYFCTGETICIGFYHTRNTTRLMVGFIIGKPIKVQIEGDEIETLEVNFLCLIPQLRSLHVSSYMISILSKMCMEKFNIFSAVYTVGKKLGTNSFCKKNYYHRPLNIKKMIRVGLLSTSYDTDVVQKVYRSFNYKKENKKKLEYYNNSLELPNINEIGEKLLSYNKRTYSVFDMKTSSNIKGLFQNPAFHTFVVKDDTGLITDMVSIFQLDTVDVTSNTNCRNGYVYSCFFDDNEVSYKFDVIECIGEYCETNEIFDMLTIMDCFGLSEKEYYINKFIHGSGSLNYYFYNAEICKIDPDKNGLVTI